MIDARKNKHKETCAAKHVSVSLRHPSLSEWGGSLGDKRACTRVFPGIISAQKVSPGELLAYTNPKPAAEEGAKVNPGRAAERCRNAGPGTALDAQCVTGTAADRFAQVKERAAEAAAAAEGDAQAGASTAERMRRLAAWRCPGSSLLIASHISRRGIVMQGCVG